MFARDYSGGRRLASVTEEGAFEDVEMATSSEPLAFASEPLVGAPKIREKAMKTTLGEGTKSKMARAPEQEGLLSKQGVSWDHGKGLLGKAEELVLREMEGTNVMTSIKQLFGMTTNKAYEVVDKRSNKTILMAEERTGFLNRNCIHPECRPIRFNVVAFKNKEAGHMMYVERPCGFVGPFRKPIYIKSSDEPNARILGQVLNKGNAAAIHFEFQDPSGKTLMDLKGSQCTGARFCGKLPAAPCREIRYNFHNPGSEAPRSQGAVTSQWNGFCQELVFDVSQYDLDVQGLSDIEKVQLIATALYMDVRFVQTGGNVRDIICKKLGRIGIFQECAQKAGGASKVLTRNYA